MLWPDGAEALGLLFQEQITQGLYDVLTFRP